MGSVHTYNKIQIINSSPIRCVGVEL